MTTAPPKLLVDCSVVVKWKFASEPQAAEAEEMLLDWQAGEVELRAPDQLRVEVLAAFLKGFRQRRLSKDEARDAIREVLVFPLTYYKTTRPVVLRAFDIAAQHNLRPYDCTYVALAERKRVGFWTGDVRLYNTLHVAHPFISRLADYLRKRPGP